MFGSIGWGFRDGGSNGGISGWIKSKMVARDHLGKLQTAIYPQRIVIIIVIIIIVERWSTASTA